MASTKPIGLPHQSYLLKCFIYDRATGVLVRRRRVRSMFKTDAAWLQWNGTAYTLLSWKSDFKAGSKREGFSCVTLDGTKYKTARVIWKLVTGHDPAYPVTYLDGKPNNLKWANLALSKPAVSKAFLKAMKEAKDD